MDDPCERGGFLFFWNGWPSQWHPSPFVIEGVRYRCCEQYMMAEKARLFGDEETRREVMKATSPREQKALGREVTPFDPKRWTAACRDVVYRGNLAKYSQNAELGALLLATGDLILAEASPSDTIGIWLRRTTVVPSTAPSGRARTGWGRR